MAKTPLDIAQETLTAVSQDAQNLAGQVAEITFMLYGVNMPPGSGKLAPDAKVAAKAKLAELIEKMKSVERLLD